MLKQLRDDNFMFSLSGETMDVVALVATRLWWNDTSNSIASTVAFNCVMSVWTAMKHRCR